MIQFSDEVLMAFADGELDDATRELVQRAMASDPRLAARIELHGRFRRRVQAAFVESLGEPVPERLFNSATAGLATSDKIVSLHDKRVAKEASQRRWTEANGWPRWGGMAASLAIGMILGNLLFNGGHGAMVVDSSHGLIAAGGLNNALSTQLAVGPSEEGGVSLNISFVDKSGAYCRTFISNELSGLACRDADQWRIQVLARLDQMPVGEMRQANSTLPASVLNEIDRRIDGNPLDTVAQRSARDHGWHR